MHTCTCVHAYGGQRSVSSSVIIQFIFWDKGSYWSRSWPIQLDWQQVPGTLPSSPPWDSLLLSSQHWDGRCAPPCLLLHRSWGSNSGPHASTASTNSAISEVPPNTKKTSEPPSSPLLPSSYVHGLPRRKSTEIIFLVLVVNWYQWF